MDEENSVPLNLVVAIPTFIGSLLSVLATCAAVVLHIMHPPTRHFRHALIINLLVSDFINSLNNTISGIVILRWGRTGNPEMPPSSSCIANGWIAQVSVQTVDFTILLISVSVLMVVLSKTPMAQPSLRATIIMCAAVWVPGIITSFVGLGYNVYGHVSGNWCWILPIAKFRYGLTHGWRMAIFVATIGIYTAIYIHLKRVFNKIRLSKGLSNTSGTTTTTTTDTDLKTPTYDRKTNMNRNNLDNNNDNEEGSVGRKWRISAPMPQENFHTGGINAEPPASIPLRQTTTTDVRWSIEDSASTRPLAEDEHGQQPYGHHGRSNGRGHGYTSSDEELFMDHMPPPRRTHGTVTTVTAGPLSGDGQGQQQQGQWMGGKGKGTGATGGGLRHRSMRMSVPPMPPPPNLKKMLLMNGYPIAYIILWIPGMANRLVEVINGSSPVWLRALQASTQFVGVANAITYGLNEQTRGQWTAWRKRNRRAGD